MKVSNFKIENLYAKKFERDSNIEQVLIAIHGFTSSSNSDMIRQIADTVTKNKCLVIAFDLPRHGQNDNKEVLNLNECFESLKSVDNYVKQNYKDKKISYFASSFGGYLLLNFLNNSTYKYHKIFLRAPAIFMDEIAKSISQRIYKCDIKELENKIINLGKDKELLVDNNFYNDLKNNRLIENYKGSNYLYVIQGKKDIVVDYKENEKFLNEKCKDNYKIFYFEESDHSFKKEGEIEKIAKIVNDTILND